MQKRIYHIVFALVLLLSSNMAWAQIKVNDDGDAEGDDAPAKGVVIHADSRLAVLTRKYRNVQLGVIRSGQGYRVQIYNGNDRQKATSIKVDFMRRFPKTRTYLTYVQPQFRVKVGDFRSRAEAAEMYRQVNTLYNPCMIVPDIVVINTLKDD